MKGISVKEYLPARPREDGSSDQVQLREELEKRGYAPVNLPLQVLRELYPLCRGAQGFTATLVRREADWAVVSVESGDTRNRHYALAVDYGSTTVVMQLVDLNSGAVVAQEREFNGQSAFGSDILTRITYSLEEESHVSDLHRATVQTFHDLLDRLTEASGIDARRCSVMAVAGNTTMIHFLLKLNAWTVFASPYAPVSTDPGYFWGRELEMDFDGLVYLFPAASNYIGGDIISGLLTVDLHTQEEPSLFFDIGTNGELVVGNREWLLAGAGAAGPALEGYISRFGMRAAPGAVERVRIEGDMLTVSVIGGGKAAGICGSGIIDLLAQMRLHGWVNMAGQLEPGASERIVYREEEGEWVVVYAAAGEAAGGTPLYFSQTDIRQYLDTKAAAYTMVECLLETAGIDPAQLRSCHLTGAFCAHSDLEAAITIGMFPDLPRERYHLHTNTALAGARAVLLDQAKAEEAVWLARNIYCVQFASVPDFLVRMQAAKFIPHTDMTRYPSIQKALGKL